MDQTIKLEGQREAMQWWTANEMDPPRPVPVYYVGVNDFIHSTLTIHSQTIAGCVAMLMVIEVWSIVGAHTTKV
jgi:hypothetical protein